MSNKNYTEEIFNDIGKVRFVPSIRAKRINISVKGNITYVAIPKNQAIDKARSFLLKNTDWVLKTQEYNTHEIDKIKSGIERTVSLSRQQIKNTLIQETEFLSRNLKLPIKSINIRTQKTLWGSCTKDNKINLNSRLIFLPKELRTYVIMHELVHTKVKNHQKSFWDELKKYLPDFEIRKKELKVYHVLLYY